jgi:hypothetical protein
MLVIVGRTIQAMKESFMVLETSARNMRLAVNEEKTKFMEVGKKKKNNNSGTFYSWKL